MGHKIPPDHPATVAFRAHDAANDHTVSWPDFFAGWIAAMQHVAEHREVRDGEAEQ